MAGNSLSSQLAHEQVVRRDNLTLRNQIAKLPEANFLRSIVLYFDRRRRRSFDTVIFAQGSVVSKE